LVMRECSTYIHKNDICQLLNVKLTVISPSTIVQVNRSIVFISDSYI